MNIVLSLSPGAVSINWAWLPTWIGMNAKLIRDIENSLSPLFLGKELTSDVLEEIHDAVIVKLCSSFPEISGLKEYLNALKHVSIPP